MFDTTLQKQNNHHHSTYSYYDDSPGDIAVVNDAMSMDFERNRVRCSDSPHSDSYVTIKNSRTKGGTEIGAMSIFQMTGVEEVTTV